VALNREEKAMQRIEEICKGMAKQGSDEQWNGKEKLGKAMAMDARCSFDKQRRRTAATCDAMAKNRNDRLRH
jgi:hypothetical protein